MFRGGLPGQGKSPDLMADRGYCSKAASIASANMTRSIFAAECPSCRLKHVFYYALDVASPREEYGYVCPSTSARAKVSPSGPGERVEQMPAGSVSVHWQPRLA
jgi:hypothetical protein